MPRPREWGGQGLPHALNAACIEMWNSASMAFGIGPVLTMGAVEALAAHGTDELKRAYLPKLVSGEWMGTMQLTEPQAGSDVGALRTKAERAADGSYRITGQKIFITYGEHDLTDNIIHFVLARLPDAPPGTQGHLAVPGAEVPAQRRRLARRAQRRARAFDRAQARHPRLADLHHGLRRQRRRGRLSRSARRTAGMACMFTMMNQARLAVGLQGVAHRRARDAAGAGLCARAQAGPRRRRADGSSPIIEHPDVKRMLLTMRALTRAARAICYATAVALDRAQRGKDEAARKAAHERASLLTPVAKAFSTDIGIEVASLGVQVHGGMGFIEETGAAQHYRDARIAAIYEGTNGIQAIDLVTRKLPLVGRRGGEAPISTSCARTVDGGATPRNDPAFGCDRRAARRGGRQPRARDRMAARQARQRRPTPRWPARRPICGCSRSRPAARMLAEEALAALRLAGGGADAAGAHRDRALLRREYRGAGQRARAHRDRRRRQRQRRRRGLA